MCSSSRSLRYDSSSASVVDLRRTRLRARAPPSSPLLCGLVRKSSPLLDGLNAIHRSLSGSEENHRDPCRGRYRA